MCRPLARSRTWARCQPLTWIHSQALGRTSHRLPSVGQVSAPGQASGMVYTPHRDYQHFEAAFKGDKVAAKLRELSAQVPEGVRLSSDEQTQGGELDSIVQVRCSHMLGHMLHRVEVLHLVCLLPGTIARLDSRLISVPDRCCRWP
jgi:hypothetical protein